MSIIKVFISVCLFQMYGAKVSFAKEPMCSKFSYDEQLLEKMIRTEIKVETMENEIKKTQEAVMDTLEEIKKKVNDITDKFEDLRSNITEEMATKSKDLELRTEFFKSTFENLRHNFSKDLEQNNDIINVIKEKISRGSVGYYAYHVTDTVLVTNKVIVFDRSITNEGSGYDTSTGHFTAPVDGLYLFSVHICTSGGKYAHFGIVVENTELTRASQYDKDSHTCSSDSAVASVKKGQQVWVHCTSGGSSSNRLYEDSHRWNSFSGAPLLNLQLLN